ncbi:CHRD domain-containing protein [Solitalea lacus]|uniref:CHRD domain-containing protein n=1 Tax=Solitalea lacus TaxID=2911172 RepID=UPI001EDA9EA2|nr:CHRD domain-containing protein [Solitalea lacus]UKJ07610.1 CHRD domain-containing protein [Solitalea lacus]
MKKLAYNFKSRSGVFAFILFTSAVLILNACSSSDNPEPGNGNVQYAGTFAKSNGSVVTTATGNVSGSFNPTNNELTYTVSWSNLTSNVVDMHFHDNGPIIIPITGFSTGVTGSYSGKATFTSQQVVDLIAGRIYVQIHSVNFPGGEVFATLTKSSSGPSPNPNPGY